MLPDSAQSSGVEAADMLSVLPILSLNACCKTNAVCYFCFPPVFVKEKILFEFLSISKKRYDFRSLVRGKWECELLKSRGYLYSYSWDGMKVRD